ncbi:c-type cytochrome [Rhodocytophaga aerolata]|uniref:C-type cytochrome n=1 Tax=Rhodocytophaga aerolata TaxID=455078 RepID=A0ABT8RE71_9BACT|nr:c-type cytochrome [Rhodocytophaga aerolata]MDO1449020.1 c-type cytochrome [Rhodocytophaga aerolata]
MKKAIWSILASASVSLILVTCQVSKKSPNDAPANVQEEMSFATPRTVDQNPSPAPLSPEQSLRTFRVPKGYRLELVASEPMISEPVALTWDGNGRMYVAQMETYMQTVDTTGEHVSASRVMLLEDTNGDGKMDKSSVFIDKLMLPRMVLCVGDELLVNETDTYDVYAYKDTNGDGKADQKRPVYKLGKKSPGNLEHQRSGLDWNLDNWIYVTVDPVRFRYVNGQLKPDTLINGSNGQWGLTHDNYGRLFFSRGGGENAGSGFQINPAYGQLEFRDAYIDSTFGAVWPIIKTPDIQGGLKRLREDSTLNHFTSGNGQSIFRGDRLPQTLVGDYLINEPVARIIRRAKVIANEGKTTLENAYQQEEFIASTDMNFRPVNTYTGPDGCLYIIDMNRGIIQEGTWTGPDSYLRPQILRLGLDQNKQRGRIYRLVYEGITPGPKPQMLTESTNKLVTYLDHPNGWWRDNAQKEVIVRADQTVVPILKQIAQGEQGNLSRKPGALGRLHALWTLEGLGAIDKEVVQNALKDQDAQVRRAAIWISEPYLKKNDTALINALAALQNDPSYDVRTQLLLSLQYSEVPQAKEIMNHILSANAGNEMLTSVKKTIEKNTEIRKFGHKLGNLDAASRKLILNGSITFKSLCATCHGGDGKGLPTQIAPPLVGNFRRMMEKKEAMIKIVLHGLTGPVEGKTYPDMMPPMGTNDDEWVASVLSYVRYDLGLSERGFGGNLSPEFLSRVIVTPEEVKKARDQTAGRTKTFTWEELEKVSQ